MENQENNNPNQGNGQNQGNNNQIQSNGVNSNINNQGPITPQTGNGGQGGQQYNNYTQNLNNQNTKKKSKAPIIIIIVVIVVLLFGCIISGIVFMGIKLFKNVNNVNNVNEIINEVKNEVGNNTTTNKITNKIGNKVNNTVSNSLSNNTITNTIDSQTPSTDNGDAKTSTKDNPISKGEWGIASKYSTQNKHYEDVKVKVTNITRGEEATKAVKDFVNTSSYYKYEEPKSGLEWVVVEYDVDFSNYTMPSIGTNADVTSGVEGTTSSSVKYNGTTWILSTTYIGSRDYVTTNKASGKIAMQMPIGCKDYLITFGAYGKTKAYIKGE